MSRRPADSINGYFSYGENELAILGKQAPELIPLFSRYGIIRREMTPDLFTALSESIVGQQITEKARQTILERLSKALGAVTPETILAAPVETVTACGVSLRKADYLRCAAEAVTGGMSKPFLEPLDDNEIIRHLTQLKGVGVWTAEMMLMFCFGRRDVLSFGDFGIRSALARLHGIEKLPKALFEEDRKRFSPYGTIASFYLWESNKTAAG